jgi:hypothetical protein
MKLSLHSLPSNFTFATEQNANAHETSIEIMRVIEILAGADVDVCERIWSTPTDPEVRAIEQILWMSGTVPRGVNWGAAGSSWLAD